MEKKIVNNGSSDLTRPRNLELVQKITSERNLRSIIQTRVKIPELNKKK
jgi:hypothetical protein